MFYLSHPMTRFLRVAVVVGLVTATVSIDITGQVQGPAATAALSGVVVDAVTGRPLVGAVVSLGHVGPISRQQPRMVTDRQGRFVFRDLPASTNYFLDANRL